MIGLEAEINVVVVQTSRDVSTAIEEKTGVRHQTPQAMIIQKWRGCLPGFALFGKPRGACIRIGKPIVIEPVEIIEESDSLLTIKWSDGPETAYNAAQLRKSCPCAGCVNEWTGERTLKDSDIPADMTFSQIAIVGRYALSFHFSDGHETGIFSFNYLRSLPPAS